ncbi:MAG: hypothetical protein M1832_001736 [Thelocarpon impressellum]|nr:MAG: hypothetical protein M1832_001736 [Thelocarpon impressellum]
MAPPLQPTHAHERTLPAQSQERAHREELASLRVLRASLEAVRQLVEAVHEDVETAVANHRAVTDMSGRWNAVVDKASAEAAKARTGKGKS